MSEALKIKDISKLPIRQVTYRATMKTLTLISKLPIRQVTGAAPHSKYPYLSKLPIRQVTFLYTAH